MNDREIWKTILFVALMFFLPLILKEKPPEIREIYIEPETVNVEVHLEKRTIVEHRIEAETIEEEVVDVQEEVVEDVRPVPVIAEVPEPQTNGNMVKMRITCYLPTGFNCADGTPPYFGAVASNHANMGRNFTMYRNDMTEVGNFTVHDVGGHHDLVNGSALDVFTQTIDDAWAFLYANCWVEGGSWYAWVEWEE
jgi:hypothetical protein